MLATSPAVRISGAGSCRAVPTVPEIGQSPAPSCKAEIRPLGLMEMQGTNQPPGLQEKVKTTTQGRGRVQSSQSSRTPQMSFIYPDKYSAGYQADTATKNGAKPYPLQGGLLGSPKPTLSSSPPANEQQEQPNREAARYEKA